MSEVFCADSSLAGQEPLLGTAAEAEKWLVIEHDQPWGVKGADDSGLPAHVLAHVNAFAGGAGSVRVQLARRPNTMSEGVRVWLADTRPGRTALWELSLPRVEALADVDLAAWAAGTPPAGAVPRSESMFFVCVHGRRDRCCAQRGMPVYSALVALTGERTWMTTHLGGHRFAATLVVLPEGIAYGRLADTQAAELVAAHARGELFDLAHVRGRTSYAAPAQAAEVELRQRLDERRGDALRLLGSERTPEGERVTFVHEPSGAEHTLSVGKAVLPPISVSCGATAKPGSRLVVV
jgi:hypothetical protein